MTDKDSDLHEGHRESYMGCFHGSSAVPGTLTKHDKLCFFPFSPLNVVLLSLSPGLEQAFATCVLSYRFG